MRWRCPAGKSVGFVLNSFRYNQFYLLIKIIKEKSNLINFQLIKYDRQDPPNEVKAE